MPLSGSCSKWVGVVDVGWAACRQILAHTIGCEKVHRQYFLNWTESQTEIVLPYSTARVAKFGCLCVLVRTVVLQDVDVKFLEQETVVPHCR